MQSLKSPGFFHTSVPVADMREAPKSESKIVSQTLLGESIRRVDAEGDWLLVQTPDEYEGWVPKESVVSLSEPYESNAAVGRTAVHVYGEKTVEYGPIVTLPYGSRIRVRGEEDPRWEKVVFPKGTEGYIQKGDLKTSSGILSKRQLVSFSKQFLHLPYTWGGRSGFGFDCSGFVQMLYAEIGIRIPRDARDQILAPVFREVADDPSPGDLIFWGTSKETVSHVGMYIGRGAFIHATAAEGKPRLRISKLTDPAWRLGAEERPFRKILTADA